MHIYQAKKQETYNRLIPQWWELPMWVDFLPGEVYWGLVFQEGRN